MKSVILVSILAMGLTACSNSASEIKDENQLPNGIMQPVVGTGAAEGGYALPSEIQTAPMPASMAK